MKEKNLELPKEGDIVIVTGKIDGNMSDRIGDNPVGTCVVITDSVVGVAFENGDIWWGKPYEVFVETPEGLEPPRS